MEGMPTCSAHGCSHTQSRLLCAVGTARFKRYRGRAVGYKGFGLEMGVNLVFAPIMQQMLDGYGWRTANRLLAIVCTCTASGEH